MRFPPRLPALLALGLPLLGACASQPKPGMTAEERAHAAKMQRLEKEHGAVGATFLDIGGTLEQTFTGRRTVDQ